MHRQCIKKCTRNAPLECRGAGVHSVCGQRASDCAVNLSKQTAFRARKSPPACIDCAQTASENARKGSQNYGQNAPSARRTGVMPAVDLHATVESLLPPGQAGWRAGAGVLCLCSWPVVIPPGRARRKSDCMCEDLAEVCLRLLSRCFHPVKPGGELGEGCCVYVAGQL